MFENLKKNIKPITGSVLVAFVLWLMIATEKEYNHKIIVPMQINRLATGKALVQKIPDFVVLELQGKGRSLIALSFYDIKFNLEFPNLKSSQKIKLQDYLSYLDLPATFSMDVVEIIEPTTIDLVLDDLLIEKKPVYLFGSVGTKDGYAMLNYKFDSDSVIVSGPKSIVQSINHIYTEKISVKDKNRNFSQQLNLVSPNPDIIHLNPQSVQIDFDIQRLVERVVYDIPISIINIPSNLNVEADPNKLALRIKGGERIIAAVQQSDIIAEIDFEKNYHVNQENYGVRIIVADDIQWIESIPKTFNLVVKKINSSSE